MFLLAILLTQTRSIMTKEVKATPENYLELMSALSVEKALQLACSIANRLQELNLDDDNYWLEKPHKFPEYWVPALNGTLDDYFFYPEEEYETTR
jgi:hypothetical protein